MEAYCVKCKTKRETAEAEAAFATTGTPETEGKCLMCRTNMHRMGEAVAHANLSRPEIVERKSNAGHNRYRSPNSGKRFGKLVSSKLVIVESLTKARTVGCFFGKGYAVKVSIGHIRDLLQDHMGEDVEHDFRPHPMSNEQELFSQLARRGPLADFPSRALWFDIGTFERLSEVEQC